MLCYSIVYFLSILAASSGLVGFAAHVCDGFRTAFDATLTRTRKALTCPGKARPGGDLSTSGPQAEGSSRAGGREGRSGSAPARERLASGRRRGRRQPRKPWGGSGRRKTPEAGRRNLPDLPPASGALSLLARLCARRALKNGPIKLKFDGSNRSTHPGDDFGRASKTSSLLAPRGSGVCPCALASFSAGSSPMTPRRLQNPSHEELVWWREIRNCAVCRVYLSHTDPRCRFLERISGGRPHLDMEVLTQRCCTTSVRSFGSLRIK